MEFTTELTLARAFLQLTQALRVTDSGTLRRFEVALLLLLSAGVLFAASEFVDSEDWCSGLVGEGRMLRKDIVELIPIKPCGYCRDG